MKYKCLVLDHDDTLVRSTSEIHYPSFKKTIEEVKPWLHITREEFILNCFDPGFFDYMEKKLGFTQEEMNYQLESWLKYIAERIPRAYDGMNEIIERQKAEGGLVCVVSHSYSEVIRRDYAARVGILPDRIYGGEEPPERRKPSTFPLLDIMEHYSLAPHDLVVVDDLKPGLDMARAADVPFICAGWSHEVEKIADYMKKNAPVYAPTVASLVPLLFE